VLQPLRIELLLHRVNLAVQRYGLGYLVDLASILGVVEADAVELRLLLQKILQVLYFRIHILGEGIGRSFVSTHLGENIDGFEIAVL
jgi:hypothetical protein